MSKGRFFHSSFTPSEADPETLEAMLVGRSRIARRLVERIRDSATSGEKHQDLLIGPRGIGKTHLLSLVRHRIKEDDSLHHKLAIAWLPEDPYESSYTDLLLEILRELADEYPSEDFDQRISTARSQHDPDLLETELEQTLMQWLSDRTLLILVENLQDLFSGIGESGQEKLRALIQNTGQITIVATSTSLFPAVARRNKMFFGFFRQTELLPLNVLEARELLVRLAQIEGDTGLEEQLRSPLGLARIRAMHLLAGGSPRVCTLFYEFLTCDSIDTLLVPFKQLVDKLMPYYQGLMHTLSPQQRRIMEAFCRAEGACSAPSLANELHIKSQTVSTQIRRLCELGYLSLVDKVARGTLFELREPLMRYTIQSKQDRGEYLKHIIEFLRLWYSPSELEERAEQAQDAQDKRYLVEAALRSNRDGDPIVKALRADFTTASASGDHEAALQALDGRLARNEKDLDALETKAQILAYRLKRPKEALPYQIRATEIDPSRPAAWVKLAALHFESKEIEEAVTAMRRAVVIKPKNPENLRLLAWYLLCGGKKIEAQEIYTQVVEAGNEPKMAEDWHQRGTDLSNAGRYLEALRAYLSAIELQPGISAFWDHTLGFLQHHFWRVDLCLKLSEVAIQLFPDNHDLRVLYAISLGVNMKLEEGLTVLDSIVAQDKYFEQNSLKFRLFKVRVLMFQGRSENAMSYLEDSVKPSSRYDSIRYESARASLYAALGNWKTFKAVTKDLLTGQPVLTHELWGSPLDAIEIMPRSTWRESASQWIKAFAECAQLPLLAAKISAHARILASGEMEMESAAAESWLEVFRTEAEPYVELQPAIRTLAFVLSYLKDPDPTRILALPKEERILVEPGLAESQADRPTEIDKQIESFIERLKIRAKRLREEQERKAYWDTPAPSGVNVLENLQIALEGSNKVTLAKTLLYGDWVDVQNDAVEMLLGKLVQDDETIRKVMARPGLAVVRVRQRTMICSALDLYQIDIREDGRYGAIDVLYADGKTVLLDGGSLPLHRLVADHTIRTDSAEERDEYLVLFCCTLRGEEGRFALLFPDDLQQFEEPMWDGNENAVAMQRTQEFDDGAMEYRALVQYSDHLFKANFRLPQPGNSNVEMFDEEPIKELNFVEEIFDGPIRWVWRKPKESYQSD